MLFYSSECFCVSFYVIFAVYVQRKNKNEYSLVNKFIAVIPDWTRVLQFVLIPRHPGQTLITLIVIIWNGHFYQLEGRLLGDFVLRLWKDSKFYSKT